MKQSKRRDDFDLWWEQQVKRLLEKIRRGRVAENQSPAVQTERDSLSPLSRDEQRLRLWEAIQRITYGNKTDDKLIVAELHKAGFCIATIDVAPSAQHKEQR